MSRLLFECWARFEENRKSNPDNARIAVTDENIRGVESCILPDVWDYM